MKTITKAMPTIKAPKNTIIEFDAYAYYEGCKFNAVCQTDDNTFMLLDTKAYFIGAGDE